MGGTQSAQREDKQDAAVEQRQQPDEEEEERENADDALTEQMMEAKNSKNGGPINVAADHSLVGVNGHHENEIVSQVIVLPEEDNSQTEKPLKEKLNKEEADENLEIIEMNVKQNDINKSFQKFFSNIGLKVTVKKGSSVPEETVEKPNLTGDIEAIEESSKNDLPENCDSTPFFSLQPTVPEDVIEKAEQMATASKEEVECEDTDAEIILLMENQQHEVTAEKEPHSTSPVSPEDEMVQSPIKRFFSTGIFSGLRKKKKLAEDDAARDEQEAKLKKEVPEITEPSAPVQEQDLQGVGPAEAEPPKKEEMATSEMADEKDRSLQTDISSLQEKEKAQASPLKMFLSGSSMKRKTQRSRSSSDARLSDSGERVSDQIPQPIENQKDTVILTDAPKEEDSAWASFIKLLTPKKRIKKSSITNEELQVPCAEEEVKRAEREQISDHSTEEGRKRKDSLVSWEAVLCGSGRRRSRKTSDSDDETLQADNGSKNCTLERKKSAESPYDSEPGSAWNSLKRIVSPKRKSKDEHEPPRDNAQSDNEQQQEDSSFSIKKLLPGHKKSKSDEKQVGVSSDEANKDVASDDEDSETPAVVPLSEYDIQETDIQTEPIVEHQSAVDKDEQLQEDLSGEPAPPASHIVAKEPGGAEFPDDISESTSEHHLLSDIPEEGIITETMAIPVLALEEAATDETIAEEPLEITSEAITAPEPSTDNTLEDETEMISAVSQLTSQSSKTSGNTTPVQANYDILETDKVLLQVVETISPSAQTDPLVSEEVISQNISRCLLQEPCEAIEQKRQNVLEIHRRSDATAFRTGLNVNEIESINELAAETNRECVSEINTFIPTEIVQGVASARQNNAIVSVDEIHEASVNKSEEINELEMMETRHPLEESLSKTQALKDVSPQEDEIVGDTCTQDKVPQTETKNISRAEECNAPTGKGENEEVGIAEQAPAEAKEKSSLAVEKSNTLLVQELLTLESGDSMASQVTRETPPNEKPIRDSLDEGLAAEIANAKEKEAAEMVEAMKSTPEKITVQTLVTPDLEVKYVESPQLTETVLEESKEEPKVITEVNHQPTSVMETEAIQAVQEPLQDMVEVHSQSMDKQELSLKILEEGKEDSEINADVKMVKALPSDSEKSMSHPSEEEAKQTLRETVENEPFVAVKTSDLSEVSQVDQNTKEETIETFQMEILSENIPEVEKVSEEQKDELNLGDDNFKDEPALKTLEQLKTPETVQNTEESSIQYGNKKTRTDSKPEAEKVADEAKEVLFTAVGHKSEDTFEHIQSPEVPHAVYDEDSVQSFKEQSINQEGILVEEHKEGSCIQLLHEENLVPEVTPQIVKIEAAQVALPKEDEASNETNEKRLDEDKQEFEETTADRTETGSDVSSVIVINELAEDSNTIQESNVQQVDLKVCSFDSKKDATNEPETVGVVPAGATLLSHCTLEQEDASETVQEEVLRVEQKRSSSAETISPQLPVEVVTPKSPQLDAEKPEEETSKIVVETTEVADSQLEEKNPSKTVENADVLQVEKKVAANLETGSQQLVEVVTPESPAKPEKTLFEGETNKTLDERKDGEDDIIQTQVSVPEIRAGPETVTDEPEGRDSSKSIEEAGLLTVNYEAASSPETSSPQLLEEVVTPENSQFNASKPGETPLEALTDAIFTKTFSVVPEMKDVAMENIVQKVVPETSTEPETVPEEPQGADFPDMENASKTVLGAEVSHVENAPEASQEATSPQLLKEELTPESSPLAEAKPEGTPLEEENNKKIDETLETVKVNVAPEIKDVDADIVQAQAAVPEINPAISLQLVKDIVKPESSHLANAKPEEKPLKEEIDEINTETSEQHQKTLLSHNQLEQDEDSKIAQGAEVMHVLQKDAASSEAAGPQLIEEVVIPESSHSAEVRPEETMLEKETNTIPAKTSEVPKMKNEDIVTAQTAAPETSSEPGRVTEAPDGAVLSDNQLEQEEVSKIVQEAEVSHVQRKDAASSQVDNTKLIEVVTPESSPLAEAKSEETLIEGETNQTSEVLQCSVVHEMEDVKEDIVQVQEAVADISPEQETVREEPERTVTRDDSKTVQEAEVLHVEPKEAASLDTASPQSFEEVGTPEITHLVAAKPEETPLEEETSPTPAETSEVPKIKDGKEDIVKAQTAVADTSPEPETVTEKPEGTVVADIQLEQEEDCKIVQEPQVLHEEHEVVVCPVATSPQLCEVEKPEGSQTMEAKPEEIPFGGETNQIHDETSEAPQIIVVPEMEDVKEDVVQVQEAVAETSPKPETVTGEPERPVVHETHLEQEEDFRTVQTAEMSHLVEAKAEETLLEEENNTTPAETSEVPDMKDAKEDVAKAQTAVTETSPELDAATEKPEGTVLSDTHLEQKDTTKTVQEDHDAAVCPVATSPQLLKEVVKPESSQLVEAKAEEILLEGETNLIHDEKSEVLQLNDVKEDEEDIVKAQTVVPKTSPELETVPEKAEGTLLSDIHQEQQGSSKTVPEAEVLHDKPNTAAAISEQTSLILIKEAVPAESFHLAEAKPGEPQLEEETNTVPAETSAVFQYDAITGKKDVEASTVGVQELIERVEKNEKADNSVVNALGFSVQTEEKTATAENVEEFPSLTAVCVASANMESCQVKKPALHKETTPPEPTNATLTQEQQWQVTVAASQTADKQEKEGRFTDIETKRAEVSDVPQQELRLVTIQVSVEQEKEAEMVSTEIKTAAYTNEPEQMVHVSVEQVGCEQERESRQRGVQAETASLEYARVTQEILCEIKGSSVSLPDVLMEETSTTSEPMIETKLPEREFKEQVETPVPLNRENVPEASVKENVVVLVKAPAVRREDDHRNQVKVFSADLKYVETKVESLLNVGATDSREVMEFCCSTLVDCASAHAEVQEEMAVQGEEATVEEVTQRAPEDQEEGLELARDETDAPEAARKLSKSAESELSEFEYDTAGEESEDETVPLTCCTSKEAAQTSASRDIPWAEAVKQDESKDSVYAEAPDLTCETPEAAEDQESENQGSMSQCTEAVLTPDSVKSTPRLSLELKPNIKFGPPKEPECPTVTTSTLKRIEVEAKAEEQEEPTIVTKTLAQITERQEQGACDPSGPPHVNAEKSEAAEEEDQPKPADGATLDINATKIPEPESTVKLQEPPSAQRAKPGRSTEQTQEEPDQDEWMDAEEVISTREETDVLFCDAGETLEPPAARQRDDTATPERDAGPPTDAGTNEEAPPPAGGERGRVREADSESEDFAAALEDLEKENAGNALTEQD